MWRHSGPFPTAKPFTLSSIEFPIVSITTHTHTSLSCAFASIFWISYRRCVCTGRDNGECTETGWQTGYKIFAWQTQCVSIMRALSFLSPFHSYDVRYDGVVERYRMSFCPRCFFLLSAVHCIVFIEQKYQEPTRFRYILIMLCGEFACEILNATELFPFDAFVPVVAR